jgi:UDP-N-acetylglucosamine 2-epimerase (non-hydrolysing)
MKTVMTIVGTRPEAIKMAPVVKAVEASPHLRSLVCATAQHRGLLDQVFGLFGIRPDFDLDLMRPNQDLYDVTSGVLMGLRRVLAEARPDVVLVHGDTTTAFAAAVSAFYGKAAIGHVEAGLRTGEKYSPFPEELNRRLVGSLADMHFAPTDAAVVNLLAEGVDRGRIYKTGNTAIDALLWTADRARPGASLAAVLADERPMALLTAHRRENFGEPLRRIFAAVARFALDHPGFRVAYPVHPNPNVTGPAREVLAGIPNVQLIEPVGYDELVFLLRACRFVLTDSGGIQEEAPTFGKPTLVLRESTERPEAVEAGCALLVGSDPALILSTMRRLADEGAELYRLMSQAANPFGDGKAAGRIVAAIERFSGIPGRPGRAIASVLARFEGVSAPLVGGAAAPEAAVMAAAESMP